MTDHTQSETPSSLQDLEDVFYGDNPAGRVSFRSQYERLKQFLSAYEQASAEWPCEPSVFVHQHSIHQGIIEGQVVWKSDYDTLSASAVKQIADLKHDIARHVEIAAKQASEIAELKAKLSATERNSEHWKARADRAERQLAAGRGALTFSAFRTANVARCIKWHPAGIESWSPSDWLTAVTGELGELASLLKMRNRERDGLVGNKFSPTDKHVADELADVLTYLDLLAAVLHVDLGIAATSKFNEVSERTGFTDRLPLSPMPQAGVHDNSTLTDESLGLYRKYDVRRINDPTGKHDKCEYYVLDLVHDKFSADALDAYSLACKENFPQLAYDLHLKAGTVRMLHGYSTPPAERGLTEEQTIEAFAAWWEKVKAKSLYTPKAIAKSAWLEALRLTRGEK